MPLSWLREQAVGTAANVRRLLSSLSIDDLLPPSVVSTLVFVRDSVPRAFGFGTPEEHITGIVVFSAFLVIASFTLLTFVAVAFFLLAMPIALLRLIPAINKRWPLSAEMWPFWSV